MEIKMNAEILDVICAVIDFKKWICSDSKLKGRKSDNFDWYERTEQYYVHIDKPDGMRNNRSDFDRVLSYSMSEHGVERLQVLRKCETEELENYNWK